MKILSLHAKFSSFFSVCFRDLVENHDVCIRMVCTKPAADAPFSDEICRNSKVEDWQFREDLGRKGIHELIQGFQPDAIITSGWMFSEYLAACREYRNAGGLVIAFSDTQFQGRWKQRLGCLLARWRLHPSIDVVCVAGERQRQYAARLGFRGDRVWEPMLCCDWNSFAAARIADSAREPEFLYVGRLVVTKGVNDLLEAYARYRKSVSKPWGLRCIGGGELAGALDEQEGVVKAGFIQPNELPPAMASAGCFVLPSRFEPWGVVLQEAAALGLPLIASDACGAAVHLLRDGWNGYLFETGNVDHLAEAMTRMHEASLKRRSKMGEASFQLSKQFTPELWARQLVEGINSLKPNRH